MQTLTEAAPFQATPIVSEADARQAALRKKILIGAIAGGIVLAFMGKFIYTQWKFEETDDAHTAANSSMLSARVGGIVTDIRVEENQRVKAGDLLIKIDPRDYQNKVDQQTADLGSVQARLKDAERNYRRMKALLATDTVSQQQAEAAEATYQDMSRQEASLKAQLAQAQLELEYTEIKAPTDGRVGHRNVEKGAVAGPGQPLIAFVQSTEYWVVANVKETQLQDMKIGQPVEVTVDAIGGHTFEGAVNSFAPGSGSTFAVIPPDNATGNYVKIVQRVPVRISLNADSIKGFEERLVPGLSAVAEVKVH